MSTVVFIAVKRFYYGKKQNIEQEIAMETRMKDLESENYVMPSLNQPLGRPE
jgi:hypothetical protein